ncbi:MAG: ABC transporter permease [Ruminococcus flavefaciens]|nr:ABC transporter permease [Ruminococcus flavefaciens]MCM1229827.1 ABC transporter permease [Ruminococcus flavefaciens]
MKNPLIKRFPRELRGEIGRYLIIFLFIAGTISIVSGWNVAGNSMSTAYDEGFDKYSIEDGNFELMAEADDELLDDLDDDTLDICENFYIERSTEEIDSTLRIFKKRTQMNLECLMEGDFPESDDEIAIDRMYADNNEISVGDTLTLEGREFTVSGFVALSDYSALFSSPADMMFDAVKFGVAVVTEDCFESLGEKGLHYSYSWKYDERPEDDIKAKELSEDFMENLYEKSAIHGNAITEYIPEYTNQAILFAGDDIKGDSTFITLFLYIVVVIIAFIFAITTGNTIAKEATVIGTLRATGYTKGELVRHYMTVPLLVTLAGAVVGNILGYTLLKDFAASAYYGSYSLPTFVTLWNPTAFINTTVIPLLIMTAINFVMLSAKLSLSPLKFIRRDLSRKPKKKAFKLNTKIGIMKRFRLRVIFQNMPNYLMILIGIFFANAILLFGFLFTPMLDKYQDDITGNMIANYQYILKASVETETDDAEKYSAGTLKTIEGRLKSEEVTVYGISDDSQYVDIDFSDGVYISNAYAEKHKIKEGDEITLKEQFGSDEYSFTVDGIYYYPAGLSVFMSRDDFNSRFDKDEDYFSGYFSNDEITDIDEKFVAVKITIDDLTKTSRQLKLSMGSMMSIFLVFGIVMFMLIIYLLSKLIIEKNSQSISMTKILGYKNSEINGIYITTTSIVVVLAMLVTIPVVSVALEKVFYVFLKTYPGWLPYYVAPSIYVKMAVLGILSYAVIAFFQTRRVKKVPLADALKNVE